MDVREKLVELIGSTEYGNGSLVGKNFQKGFIEKIASNLIANGVTVQEWISVKDERKPKIEEDVLVVVFDGYNTYTSTDCIMKHGDWCYNTGIYKVTHWQPMPQPPKGE